VRELADRSRIVAGAGLAGGGGGDGRGARLREGGGAGKRAAACERRMGGASSVSAAARIEDYTSELSEEQQQALVSKAKSFRVFSEDLEWACKALVAKEHGEPTVLGRRSASDVVISNLTTSGKHLELTLVDKRWRAKDANSSAGTVLFWGSGKELAISKSGESHTLPVNCCMRLGACFVTLVPDSMPTDLILECTKGPMNSKLYREFLRVDSRLAAASRSQTFRACFAHSLARSLLLTRATCSRRKILAAPAGYVCVGLRNFAREHSETADAGAIADRVPHLQVQWLVLRHLRRGAPHRSSCRKEGQAA
jgi:hypothetical protein